MSVTRRGVAVCLLALAGIALAAGITYGTSRLVRQRIGLSSEPITAGATLTPRSAAPAARPVTRVTVHHRAAPEPKGATEPARAAAPPARAPATGGEGQSASGASGAGSSSSSSSSSSGSSSGSSRTPTRTSSGGSSGSRSSGEGTRERDGGERSSGEGPAQTTASEAPASGSSETHHADD